MKILKDADGLVDAAGLYFASIKRRMGL